MFIKVKSSGNGLWKGVCRHHFIKKEGLLPPFFRQINVHATGLKLSFKTRKTNLKSKISF